MNKNLDALITEQVNARTIHIDEKETEELLTIINTEDKTVANAVAKVIPMIAKAVDCIVDRLNKGGRLFYIGAGTSGRLGVIDAAECPPTYGTDPELIQAIIAGGEKAIFNAAEGDEDNEKAGRDVIKGKNVASIDTVIGITASGRTPFVLGAVQEAKTAGAFTIGLCNNTSASLTEICDISIVPEVGPEVVMGSTRMKSGTSQKLVLNMISTSVMIKLGKVYGNLMVDLNPNNEKLMHRATRIISLATDLAPEEAYNYLMQSGKNPKIAIVMAKTGTTKEQAKVLLENTGGYVYRALQLFREE